MDDESIQNISRKSKASVEKRQSHSTVSDDKSFQKISKSNLSIEDGSVEIFSEHDHSNVETQVEPKPFSYIEMLDVPRYLPEPLTITTDYLKMICNELGLIKLYWPNLTEVTFEDRSNFPENYLRNTDKEKCLLLYAENFRRQFCHKFPNRKPLFLACDNECGVQKLVCTTLRPTTLPYSEISTWENCAKFVADHIRYETLDEPILIPKRLYSPHTIFLRQSGQSFEIATCLCSLLIGLGYDAYVISGYAIKDVTERIMCRVDCPFEPYKEEVSEVQVVVEDQKYKITNKKEIQSKFILMMEQREKDKIKELEERHAEMERERTLEEEKRPFDELEGQRVHAWILLASGCRNVPENLFIEPSTGISHPLNSDLYCGIESIWNHENYWVNLQDCSQGLGNLSYDLTDTEKWEHLLVGEPLRWRKHKVAEIGEDEEVEDFWDEKHLDMPYYWSMKINIPHDVLQKRFPLGAKVTQYKRTVVEEYAPYVCEDGEVQKIVRYKDFACTDIELIEEKFENRHDKLIQAILNSKTNLVVEYFAPGREDSVIKHIYFKNEDNPEAERTIFFNSKARFDGLSKIEIAPNVCTEHYSDRDDKLYYRQVIYDKKKDGKKEAEQGTSRRPILKIIQKFLRDEQKLPYDDVAVREFNIRDREIHLKYHYGKDNVTASTRTFIKPPISEMGEGMTFRPELTYGYQAQIGAKPPRQLQLFLLLEQQIKDEKEVIELIRDFENQISEFLLLRAHEMAFSALDVSIYNREQNQEYRTGMLEQEDKQRMYKEKEVEEEIDYLSPYLARLGSRSSLTYQEALDIKYACLDDYKALLVKRANDIQHQFDKMTSKVEDMQNWYTQNHDNLSPEEEAQYFQEVNDILFYLRTLEFRLQRHKDLSYTRYQFMLYYVTRHPMLDVLEEN
ncbi:dynein regulatory complex subunit 7 [Anthonomus grandis grandis]|uniref:dynein regulatory complex subunit 7 n=1 Tax=Anthonomus grandis grandis TaxID=2921223 RepID=UPI0021661CD2|nr:dynein regulatory complex subunit 7 [Anthonomus grandis grandis]